MTTSQDRRRALARRLYGSALFRLRPRADLGHLEPTFAPLGASAVVAYLDRLPAFRPPALSFSTLCDVVGVSPYDIARALLNVLFHRPETCPFCQEARALERWADDGGPCAESETP